MRIIDQFAYSNAIRKLDPAIKAGFSLLVLILCLVIDLPLISTILLSVVILLSVFWAKLPSRVVFRILIAEGSFLLFGVLGVAVSINTVPTGEAASITDDGFSVIHSVSQLRLSHEFPGVDHPPGRYDRIIPPNTRPGINN